jgi:hypothetical protein
MRKYSGIPELLEQYMEEQGTDERWITVQELRGRFGLTRYQCNTVSGFLRRLEFRSFGRFPYIVARIEQEAGAGSSDPPRCQYLVKRKTAQDDKLPITRPVMDTGDFSGIAGLVHSTSESRKDNSRERGHA